MERKYSLLYEGDIIEVSLDQQANVLLLDEGNYYSYRKGGRFKYYGGHAEYSPYTIVVPRTGTWHLVIDLGGVSGYIRYSVNIIPANDSTTGTITPQERAEIEREIRDKQDALDEFRMMHPLKRMRIREMENEILGLKAMLRGWK